MGQNKALLTLHGEHLIERVVGRLALVSDEVLVVTNTPEAYPFLAGRVRFVVDAIGPGYGPLAGIVSALAAARHPRVLVVATDMPFLHPPLLRHLARLAPEADVVVPVLNEDGFPETLHAIYHQRTRPAMEAQLAAGQRKITRFFDQARVRQVPRSELEPLDPLLRSFFNANTPAEWAEAERLDEARSW